ncbi:MAG: hypothetical protein HXS46_06910 [Theionarchaea archaeon]|nr:MAG: hypothetical protein AYK18_03620 [Theionarchaea archaeon DG-70]MBU7010405.1 hypothetical protein [Theionarchaea archaeon]
MIPKYIKEHGIPIYVEKEFHIKPFRQRKDICYYGDIVAVYENGRRWYVVGIEIKDWKVRVGPKLARKYLKVYGQVCEYFYLAARRFSRKLLGMPSVGLFSLKKMEVVKRPQYLYPNERLRENAVKRMKKCGLKEEVIESPYQTTLDMFF